MTAQPDAATLEAGARDRYQARAYSDVVALLEGVPAQVASSPVLAFWLADSLRRIGRGTQAMAVLSSAEASFARHGNDVLHRHHLNLEGMLHFERGDTPAAEKVWRDLLEDASAARDDDFVARANNNLGVICTLQERWEEAIACHERAAAAYRALGRRRGLAQSHQNLAITYRELEFDAKADHHFVQAIRYATADGSEDEVARAEQERALLILLARRDTRLARATAQRACTRFDAIGDRGGAADAMRVMGMVEIGAGDLVRATRLLTSALERARETSMKLTEAETLEALAAALELRDDAALAGALRQDAEMIFDGIGATAWGKRTRLRMHRIAAGNASA